jgi:RNA polymerase sigma-70 factor (ECF subfamily)
MLRTGDVTRRTGAILRLIARQSDHGRPGGPDDDEGDHVRQEQVTAFVTERGPALVGYARMLTGDHDSAQDLVQDALAKAWSRWRAGADIESLEGDVRAAVLSTYLDQYRRQRLWRGRRHLLVSPEADPGRTAATETATDLTAALSHLSPRERACVVLRFYEDLTIAGIATRLRLSEGAVKRYLSDGTRRLGALMGETHTITETLEVRTEDRR